MHLRRREAIRAGLAKAMMGLPSLTVLTAGLTFAFVVQRWPLLGFALVAYLAGVAVQLSRPSLWRRVLDERRCRVPDLPAEIALLDGAARSFTARIDAARNERASVLAAFCGGVPATDAPWFDHVMQLERRAVTLIEALDRIGRYLARKSVSETRVRLDREAELRGRLAGPGAADRRWALSMAKERADTISELHVIKDRYHARLDAVVRTLELLPARLAQVTLQVSSDLEPSRDDELLRDLEAELARAIPPGEPVAPLRSFVA
jgi:hypothetical protein